MIKIIYFDYHGVLDRRHFRGLMERIAAASNRPDPAAVLSELETQADAYTTGAIQPTEFWRMIAAQYGDQAATAGQKYILHVDPIREMWTLLIRLKERYAVGLFSDCSFDKKAVIRGAYDLPEFFDVLLFSCDARLSKKDPAFYRLMLQDGTYRPEECLVVDDSAKNNALAETLGFRTYTFVDPAALADFIDGETARLG